MMNSTTYEVRVKYDNGETALFPNYTTFDVAFTDAEHLQKLPTAREVGVAKVEREWLYSWTMPS